MSYAVVNSFFEKSLVKKQLFCDFGENIAQYIENVARRTTKKKLSKNVVSRRTSFKEKAARG